MTNNKKDKKQRCNACKKKVDELRRAWDPDDERSVRVCDICGDKFDAIQKEHEKENKIKRQKREFRRRVGSVSLISFLITLFIICTLIIILFVHTAYTYDRDIGSHFDMAMETADVDIAIRELELGMELLYDVNIADDSPTALVWETDKSVASYHYENLQFIINRLEELKVWYYNGSADNQTLDVVDMYHVKLNNIQDEISQHADGLKDAWWIEHHVFLFYGWPVALIFGIFTGIAVLFGIVFICQDW